MTHEEIKSELAKLGKWYHRIELAPGVFTESVMEPSWPIWDMIRRVRGRLEYKHASVLDLGTMDGMWAFEAEKLGATIVAAGDIWQGAPAAKERFKFAQKCLGSSVDLWDLNVQDLGNWKASIIQCLGLLYHVQNPMLALHNIAQAIADGGKILLETAVMRKETGLWMRFNSDNGIYHDATTYWAPTMDCLRAMLKLAGLVIDGRVERLQYGATDRICAIVVRNGKPLCPELGMK